MQAYGKQSISAHQLGECPKDDYGCRVLADSINSGHRLTTLEVTFPRFLLAEFNTHRVLSRNSASSRAIPVAKRIEAVRAKPFVPLSFGANRPGMQASDVLTGAEAIAARTAWEDAAFDACRIAERLARLEVHKQHANRVLEPFSWHTAIVSATEWANFFALRISPMAQPEFRMIAEMMFEARANSVPVACDGWHLPLMFEEDTRISQDLWPFVSAGRCARVSYLTHDGKRDPEKDIELGQRLARDGHMSPLEHPASAGGTFPEANFRGWTQFRRSFPDEAVFRGQ